ncbi:hypothetical protein COOONC_18553 [Cooperia oncophora]
MLSSRYKQPIVEGSLLYLKDGITRNVKPRALEMKGIISQRNRLASYLSKLKPDLLPGIIVRFIHENQKTCCLSNLRCRCSHVDVSTDGYSAYLLTFGGNSNIVDSVFAPGNMCIVSTSAQPGILLVPIVESSSKNVTVRSDRLIDLQETYHLDLYNSFSTYPTTLGNLVLLMGNDEASIEQRNAVHAAILSNDYTLIEGFPGSVLLTANTHSALDNVLAKLKKYTDGSKILRLGNSASVRESVADLTLESKLSCFDGDKYKTARKILRETPLVASTCHYVPRDVLFSWRKFDYCIIDEASMVLEPVVISAIAAASRFVLVGDAHQLSPLVQNRKCSEEGMSVSLFERLQVHKTAMHSLEAQYRMNSTIAKLSSSLFYENRLRCANEDVARACLANLAGYKSSSSGDGPWKIIESGQLHDALVFVDTCAGTTSEFAAVCSDTGLIHNNGEARLVRDIVLRFLENGVRASAIGVMCVYRKQVEVIKTALGNEMDIEVNSVDQFQGRDKSVIVWSLVWTQDSGRVSFFSKISAISFSRRMFQATYSAYSLRWTRLHVLSSEPDSGRVLFGRMGESQFFFPSYP